MTHLAPEEAAALIQDGQTVGFSGFTPAGTPKAIPAALALHARAEHAAGRPFKIGVLTGASTGPSLDTALAEADAISFRTPYQSSKILRERINSGATRFYDMHLSMLPQNVRYGFLGPVHWAVLEACSVTRRGEITLTTAVGAAPTFASSAEKILIELNEFHPDLYGIHDIFQPADPPHRKAISIYSPSDRIGQPVIQVDPRRIAGIVRTRLPDEGGSFAPEDDTTRRIGQNVAAFLAAELRAGRIPSQFLPIQSGVGNIANAVLSAIGHHPEIPPFQMFTEVIQDSVISLLREDRITFVTGSSLTLSPESLADLYRDFAEFRPRLLLRPQEITNHPEVVRRLGLISINTALEADIFGNVNSTHVMGRSLMNGIGGSGDFTRNAYLSLFTCPSVAKHGAISSIVPLVSHLDHSEHSVQVIVTEQGVADLRGKDPYERARLIIANCAHPSFRDELTGYCESCKGGHTPQTLALAFAMHQRYLETGSMQGVDWSALRR